MLFLLNTYIAIYMATLSSSWASSNTYVRKYMCICVHMYVLLCVYICQFNDYVRILRSYVSVHICVRKFVLTVNACLHNYNYVHTD